MLLGLAGVVVACGSSELLGPQVAAIAVTPDSTTLTAVGDTVRLSAAALDDSGATVSATVTWSAQPASVASVSSGGLVTAVGNGTATITATAGGVSGTAAVTVAQAVTTIAMSAPTTTFRTLGRQVQLNGVPEDANGNAVPGVTLTWSSSDTAAVRVSATGQATAVRDGAATITAQADTVSGTVQLTVSQLAVALAFTDQPAFGRPGGMLDSVTVSVEDSGGSRVPSAAPTVSLALQANPRGATLGGTVQLTADSGRATFTTLTVDRSALGYTLQATATALAAATSQPFDVYLPFTMVAAGYDHSCGITTDSLAYCWGLADSSGLGTTSSGTVPQPIAVSGGLKFVAITAGWYDSCALTAAGAAYCWGANGSGELGDGNGGTDTSSPVAVSGGLTFRSLSAGYLHTCGVTTGNEAYCWGDNLNGELGDGKAELTSDVPVLVAGGLAFQSISTKNWAVCGVTTTGEGYCWGPNDNGILGNGTTGGADSVPVAVSGGLTFAAVSVSVLHACGITTAGAAYCWGSDANGRLGDGGANTDTNAPSAVAGGLTFSAIAAGSVHTCGLATSGAAYCWGGASNGELGNGNAGQDQSTPVAVLGALTLARITAFGHTCALTAAGAAFCWGADFSGELGNGPPLASTASPVLVIEPTP